MDKARRTRDHRHGVAVFAAAYIVHFPYKWWGLDEWVIGRLLRPWGGGRVLAPRELSASERAVIEKTRERRRRRHAKRRRRRSAGAR